MNVHAKLAALAVTLGAVTAGAPGVAAADACHRLNERVRVCVNPGQNGTTVSPRVEFQCWDHDDCGSRSVGVGKTGVEGGVLWVNGSTVDSN